MRTVNIKKIQTLIWQRKNEQALQEIEQLPDEEKLEGQIYKSRVMLNQRKYDAAFSIVESVLTDSSYQLSSTQELGARVTKMLALWRLRNLPEAVEEMTISEQVLDKIDTEQENIREWEADLLAFKAGSHLSVGEIEKALECFIKSLALFETIGYKQGMYYQLNNIGWIYRAKGELEKALDYIQKQLSISKEIGEEKNIAWSHYSMGYISFYTGDLNRALTHAQESLALFKELKHETGLSEVNVLLGSVYRGWGEYERSSDFYHSVLAKYDDSLKNQKNVPHCICVAFRDLGIILYDQNKIAESIESYKKAQKIHKELCRYRNTMYDFELALLNLRLIISYLEIGENEKITVCLERLTESSNQWPWLSLLNKIAKALVLKNKQRARYRIKAQELLEGIINERFDYEIQFLMYVIQTELLLDELRFIGGGEEVLFEVQDLLNRISGIANKLRSFPTLVILYSLRARLALLEGNVELSNELLSRALSIANNKGLDLYSSELVKQQNLLFSQVEEWQAILNRNSVLQERISKINLQKYITEAIKIREIALDLDND